MKIGNLITLLSVASSVLPTPASVVFADSFESAKGKATEAFLLQSGIQSYFDTIQSIAEVKAKKMAHRLLVNDKILVVVLFLGGTAYEKHLEIKNFESPITGVLQHRVYVDTNSMSITTEWRF